jgi:hypothetical protein
MTLMEAYRLTLRERVYNAKGIARLNPSSAHLVAYGQAILASWEADTGAVVSGRVTDPRDFSYQPSLERAYEILKNVR